MIAAASTRRYFLRRAIVVAAGLGIQGLPSLAGDADAAGELAPPDPLPDAILPSGVEVELADFVTAPATASSRPLARVNFIYFAPDESDRVFVVDSRGPIHSVSTATGEIRTFLDLRVARSGKFREYSPQMGVRSLAFHPDYAVPGRPGHRKLYTVQTEAPTGPADGAVLYSGPFEAFHHNVVLEWEVDPCDPDRVRPESAREILRIAQPFSDHATDTILFDPNARPGCSDYGILTLACGDGGNSPAHFDPYDSAQDPSRALGKILRIDPLRQPDGSPYGIPPDNPFRFASGYLPEIWALGLRHPQNLSFDLGGDRRLLFSDIGQGGIEEVNVGVAGANYGWPVREGTFVTDRTAPARLFELDPNEAAGFTYPVAQYDHDDVPSVAIVGGYVYRGCRIPQLVGHYIFGDIVSGRVYHVPIDDLRLGQQAMIRELTLKRGDRTGSLVELVDWFRADLRFGQDRTGEIYVSSKITGQVFKMDRANGLS